MKFKTYLSLITGPDGFVPTPNLRWVVRKNPSPTAREEAIAAEVLRQANPRENITGHFPWGPEEQMVLQQEWIYQDDFELVTKWRDVPIHGAEALYSTVQTKSGPLKVPNAIREPADIPADLQKRVREVLGEDE